MQLHFLPHILADSQVFLVVWVNSSTKLDLNKSPVFANKLEKLNASIKTSNNKICKKLYRTEWKWQKNQAFRKSDIIEEIWLQNSMKW